MRNYPILSNLRCIIYGYTRYYTLSYKYISTWASGERSRKLNDYKMLISDKQESKLNESL